MSIQNHTLVSLETMKQLVETKMVRHADHPRLPITIYNYSQMVQYKKRWTDLLMRCRGIVIDQNTGQVVASPMPKFFNYEEGRHQSFNMDEYDVIEKLDGSLGVYFRYRDEWVFASRGSFVSSQAKKGAEMATKKKLDEVCDPEFTYMFEVIYPGNRIVVDYEDRSELVLLAMIRTRTADDLPFAQVYEEAQRLNLSTPRTFSSDSPESLQALDTTNEEGFILRSRRTGERIKLKFPHYLEIHKVRMGFSLKYVRAWFLASPDGILSPEKYDSVPDESYSSVQDEWKRLDAIAAQARIDFRTLIETCESLELREVPNTEDKKYICKYSRIYRSGDVDGANAVYNEFAKQRVKEAPEVCDEIVELAEGGM